jgi:hypothetical protein
MFICLFPGSRVTTDQRVVAKQEIGHQIMVSIRDIFKSPRPFCMATPQETDHPQNKRNENSRSAIGLSPEVVPGGEWCQLKR